MNTPSTVASGATSSAFFVNSDGWVIITPASGASCLAQYTLDTPVMIAAATATWVTVGTYSVNVAIRVDEELQPVYFRLTASSGAVSYSVEGELNAVDRQILRSYTKAVVNSLYATYAYDTSGNTTGLVGAGGSLISFAGPSYTWAGKPDATTNSGNSIRITDIGPVGAGSIWLSNGTLWSPLNGTALHCKASATLAAPLVTVAAAAGKFVLPAGDRVTAGSILIPLTTPQIGQGVRVSAKFQHRGTGGTWQVACRIGSLDTSSDPSFASSSGTAVDLQSTWLLQDMQVATTTTFIASTFLVPNSTGTSAIVLRNTNFNTAAQTYVSFYAVSLNAADFIDLVSYRLEFVD